MALKLLLLRQLLLWAQALLHHHHHHQQQQQQQQQGLSHQVWHLVGLSRNVRQPCWQQVCTALVWMRSSMA
jgi:hypothetical protein